MGAQAGNQLALHLLLGWRSSFHRIAHVRIEHLNEHGRLLGIGKIRLADGDLLTHSESTRKNGSWVGAAGCGGG
jgi:hypothetical protein